MLSIEYAYIHIILMYLRYKLLSKYETLKREM